MDNSVKTAPDITFGELELILNKANELGIAGAFPVFGMLQTKSAEYSGARRADRVPFSQAEEDLIKGPESNGIVSYTFNAAVKGTKVNTSTKLSTLDPYTLCESYSSSESDNAAATATPPVPTLKAKRNYIRFSKIGANVG